MSVEIHHGVVECNPIDPHENLMLAEDLPHWKPIKDYDYFLIVAIVLDDIEKWKKLEKRHGWYFLINDVKTGQWRLYQQIGDHNPEASQIQQPLERSFKTIRTRKNKSPDQKLPCFLRPIRFTRILYINYYTNECCELSNESNGRNGYLQRTKSVDSCYLLDITYGHMFYYDEDTTNWKIYRCNLCLYQQEQCFCYKTYIRSSFSIYDDFIIGHRLQTLEISNANRRSHFSQQITIDLGSSGNPTEYVIVLNYQPQDVVFGEKQQKGTLIYYVLKRTSKDDDEDDLNINSKYELYQFKSFLIRMTGDVKTFSVSTKYGSWHHGYCKVDGLYFDSYKSYDNHRFTISGPESDNYYEIKSDQIYRPPDNFHWFEKKFTMVGCWSRRYPRYSHRVDNFETYESINLLEELMDDSRENTYDSDSCCSVNSVDSINSNDDGLFSAGISLDSDETDDESFLISNELAFLFTSLDETFAIEEVAMLVDDISFDSDDSDDSQCSLNSSKEMSWPQPRNHEKF